MGDCQTSMLWNWDVNDSCFLAASWHITNNGAFAATCIGVILLVLLVEFTRRLSREYDEFLLRQCSRQATRSRANLALKADERDGMVPAVITLRASPLQQLIRAVLYAATVAGAYILMLIAMSFNGYVIICIFIGAGLGKFLCDWLVVKIDLDNTSGLDVKTHLKDGSEAAVCCA
ncbi:hypothetical protein AMS68_005360 [Peltaster fructicola]|uniref:Copper transport protein n=1 Tax=Peltaster fructicola TaxID=286661 RepID=A0A6H0XYL2_9PEZI|nr:hypothetical protein AMS68_005360 [Peltaster fructicola]